MLGECSIEPELLLLYVRMNHGPDTYIDATFSWHRSGEESVVMNGQLSAALFGCINGPIYYNIHYCGAASKFSCLHQRSLISILSRKTSVKSTLLVG